nr:MAG TPA: hypothetical protein [Caudoviricetes sp.]
MYAIGRQVSHSQVCCRGLAMQRVLVNNSGENRS